MDKKNNKTLHEVGDSQTQHDKSPMEIIDADVHPWVNGDINGLLPYMSKSWMKHFEGRYILPNHPLRPPLARGSSNRIDAIPPGGGEPGSDPAFMREELLERYNIKYAVLSSIQSGKLVTLPNANEAIVLARAFNDYFLQTFCYFDSRFKLAMVVAAHDPLEAAKEIRRIGKDPQVVAVFMPLINTLMGNRYYYPVYEAAQEFQLPILIHPTGTEGGFSTSISFAGGIPSTYIERHTSFSQIGMANIVSMIFEGVFSTFPNLKVLASEFGYSWLPHVLWRMDQNWQNFRKEVPWVQEPPSQIALRHFRLTTQPLEEPPKRKYLEQIFEMIEAEKTLVFSTDYPHWDNDFPDRTLTWLPESSKRRIFYENAAELFPLK